MKRERDDERSVMVEKEADASQVLELKNKSHDNQIANLLRIIDEKSILIANYQARKEKKKKKRKSKKSEESGGVESIQPKEVTGNKIEEPAPLAQRSEEEKERDEIPV